MIYKTLHRKQKLEQHEHGVNSSVSVNKAVSAPLIISFLFYKGNLFVGFQNMRK